MSHEVLATDEVFQAIYLDPGAKPKQKVVFLEPMFDTEPPGIVALKSLRLEDRWGLLLEATKLRLVDFQDKYKSFEKKIELGKDFDPKEVLRKISKLAEEMGIGIAYVQKGVAGKSTASASALEILSDYAPEWFWKTELDKLAQKDVVALANKLKDSTLKPEQRAILAQWLRRAKKSATAGYFLAEGVADRLNEPVEVQALSVWSSSLQEVQKKSHPQDVIFVLEGQAALVSIPDSKDLVAPRTITCQLVKKTYMMGVGWMAEIRPIEKTPEKVESKQSVDLYKPIRPLEIEMRTCPGVVMGDWVRIPGGMQQEVKATTDIKTVLESHGHQLLPSGTAIAEIGECVSTFMKNSEGYSWVVTPAASKVEAILRKKYREDTEQSEWALLSRDGSRVLRWFGPRKPSQDRVQQEERRIQYFKHAK